MGKASRRKKAGKGDNKERVMTRTAKWVDLPSRTVLWGVEIELAGNWYPCTIGRFSLVFNLQYDACAYLEMLAQEKGVAWKTR
jgi:hypothetical protein